VLDSDLEILHERTWIWAEMEAERERHCQSLWPQFEKTALPEKKSMMVMNCGEGAAVWMVRSVLYDG
jgi:hypothetical protein